MQNIADDEIIETKKKKLIGFYDYTVILTYLGMICGFMGICFAVTNKFGHAMLCLMISGLCDMIDGTVASTKQRTKSEKLFGMQIDSLSDLICFGVLPAVSAFILDKNTYLCMAICGFYTLCGLIRLAYYNVIETEHNEKNSKSSDYFNGVPITTIALLFPLIYLFYDKHQTIFLFCLLITGVLFILPIKIKKTKTKGKIILAVLGIVIFVLVIIKVFGGGFFDITNLFMGNIK